MNYSYWEIKHWFSDIDLVVIGSGIVGLTTALSFKQAHPDATILILEKGELPQGASTKNAGFACFGSLSELLNDLKTMSEKEVVSLVEKRLQGLQILKENLGADNIGYRQYGGFELFLQDQEQEYHHCLQKIEDVNELLKPVFKQPVFQEINDPFSFGRCMPKLIFSPFEAQIDTGAMMKALLKKVISNDILILNGVHVQEFTEKSDYVLIKTTNFELRAGQLAIATNGFSKQLFQVDLKPARGQVLITRPIDNLSLKGIFHLEEGYYYFRNIDNRILFGGARNMDIAGETTTDFGRTDQIQARLDELLAEVIMPANRPEVDYRWSGIMGVGPAKHPIVKKISDKIVCGVRLGGMGVAIGPYVGQEIARLIVN